MEPSFVFSCLKISNFPRNKPPNFAQYISEQSLLKRLLYGVLMASKG